MDKFNSCVNNLKASGRVDGMFKDLEKGRYDKKKQIGSHYLIRRWHTTMLTA